MSAIVTALLGVFGAAGAVAVAWAWVGRRERQAVEAERTRAHRDADRIRAARDRSERVIAGQRDEVLRELDREHRDRMREADDDIEAAERSLEQRTRRPWR